MTPPAWFMTATAGDRIVAIDSIRNRIKSGKTYRIARFVGQPGMVSDYGPYTVGVVLIGNPRTVFDPRHFRPETLT